MVKNIVKSSSGKNMSKIKSLVDNSKVYSAVDAIKFLKELSFVKFDSTLDIIFRLGVDPRHSDQMVRGVVSLPAGTGKNVRVAVICKEDRIASATDAGADIVGGQDLVDRIKGGFLDFDVCITSPDMMGLVGQVARILGPKGLMPNPKLGTVSTDIVTAINNAKSGQAEYRVEKTGIVHAGIGKLSFKDEDLLENVKAFFAAILKSKPSGLKGSYMNQVFLSSTMGPALKLDLSSLS